MWCRQKTLKSWKGTLEKIVRIQWMKKISKDLPEVYLRNLGLQVSSFLMYYLQIYESYPFQTWAFDDSWVHEYHENGCSRRDGVATHRWSRVWTRSEDTACKMRMRWVKTAFHTPSSNSWRRSGTSIVWKLKPNFARRGVNYLSDVVRPETTYACGYHRSNSK